LDKESSFLKKVSFYKDKKGDLIALRNTATLIHELIHVKLLLN